MNFSMNLINLDHYAKNRLSISILVLEETEHEKLVVKMKATFEVANKLGCQSVQRRLQKWNKSSTVIFENQLLKMLKKIVR